MTKAIYRSQYEAYPFLSEHPEDYRCDFEIFTDEIASMTGFLRALVTDKALQDELLFVCELIYHINPSLRVGTKVTEDELVKVEAMAQRLQSETSHRCKQFVLPQGSESGTLSHVLRAKCKTLVRLLYRHSYQGHQVDSILFDFTNLLSSYFFFLALKLNEPGYC
jgi:ATP:cob(I)alamin adenosyltransferase